MTHTCPPNETLSAWLDDELDASASLLIRSHLENCAACREQVVGWIDAARECATVSSGLEHDSRARLTTCLDDETLVAYSEAEISAAEAARAEQHLRQCTHCVSEVQRLIHLRTSLESPPQKAEIGSLASIERPVLSPVEGVGVKAISSPLALGERIWVRAQALLARCREWMELIGVTFAKPWPALGAIAATVLLVLVIVRFLPGGGDVQFRGIPRPVKVQVITDNAIAHARPSDTEPIVATLSRGTQATRLEQSGGWTRIELLDGRRVWVRSQAVKPVRGSTP